MRKPVAVAKMVASKIALASVVIASTGTWTLCACTHMYASFGLVERDFDVQRTIKSLLLFACVVGCDCVYCEGGS